MNRTLFIAIAAALLPFHGAFGQDAETDTVSVGHVYVDATRNSWHAVLADNGSDRVFCAWSERHADGARIRGAVYDVQQRTPRRRFTISEDLPGCEDVRPAAAWLGGGGVLVAWQHSCGDLQRLRAVVLDADAGHALRFLTVSDAEANAMMPAAGTNAKGEAVVAWQDYRNGQLDVFAQRFSAGGGLAGVNVQVNDDASRALQGPPRVAADNGERFLLLWPDNRFDAQWKFYYALLDQDGVSANVLIDSAQRKAMTTLASAVCVGEDSALFAWKDYREGHSNIYMRRADLRLAQLTPAVRMNDDDGARWQRLAVLDSDSTGSGILAWEDYRNTETNQRGDIYLQVLRRGGSPAGGNVRVNDRSDRIARKMPKIAMLRDGKYLVIWHQGEEGRFELYGQWFRYPDERIGGNFCLTCDD